MIQCESLQSVVSLSALLCGRPQFTLLGLSLFVHLQALLTESVNKVRSQELLVALLSDSVLLRVVWIAVNQLGFILFTSLVRVLPLRVK